MKLLFLCLLFVNFFSAKGTDITWHEGAVVLKNGTVRTGSLHVDQRHLVILLMDNDSSVSVYTPDKISGAWFYDELRDVNRRFCSVFKKGASTRSWQLLEVVIYGEVSVVRCPNDYSGTASDDEFSKYHYYVISGDNIFSLRKFGRRIFPDMVKVIPSLADFASDQRLSFYRDRDTIIMIEKFNQLKVAESGGLLVRHP
jgi:hypothetical protein